MKKIIFVLFIISIVLIGCQQESKQVEEVSSSQKIIQEKTEPEIKKEGVRDENPTDTQDSDQEVNRVVIIDDPTSIEVLVNKQRKLPDGYIPPDLVVPDVPFYFDEFAPKKQMRQEAADALESLFEEAEKAQLDLVGASGYRSYERQKQIYENNVATQGQETADKFSAKPGTSEHQTGLAMDLTTAEVAFSLEETFSQTGEGEWLVDNAQRFGFIIRYPKGKSDITGYSYEPWHIRYVGKTVAKSIYEQSITLDEYFDMENKQN